MKILQVINSLDTGGAEKLLLETIPLYAKKGITMDLLLLKGSEQPFLKDLKKQKCCKIYDLGNGSVYNPFHIFKIIPFLKKYELVHVHLFPSLYWVSIAKMLSRKKTILIYTEHSTSNSRRDFRFFKFIDGLIYSMFDCIVSISKEVEFNLRNHLQLKLKKSQIINNGVNLGKISLSKPYSKEKLIKMNNSSILIQVSSFREPKDHETVIRALKEIPNNVVLLLIGSGPKLNTIKNLVEDLKLKERVQFMGIRMDVPQLLKTADMVVLSSKYEGLSLSSVEGLASGKPFIASNVPGLKEVVGGAGLLFEQGNYKELAAHINKLLEDKLYYNEVVNRCVERSKEYDICKMVDEHLIMYKTLIDEKETY